MNTKIQGNFFLLLLFLHGKSECLVTVKCKRCVFVLFCFLSIKMSWCLTWQAPYLKSGCLRDSSQGRRSCSPQSSSDVSFSGTRLLSQLQRSWGILGLALNLGMSQSKVEYIRSCTLESCDRKKTFYQHYILIKNH